MRNAATEELYDEPLTIEVLHQAVVILGPDGLAISITPDACEVWAAQLQRAAAEARRAPPGEALLDGS